MSFDFNEYKRLAKDILNESIKTALFVDENALEPFTSGPNDEDLDINQTQKLSRYLFKHFHKNQIALTIHQFKNVDSTKPYLRNKDIVLLDWHLDGIRSGEEYALELLEEIVKEKSINFCCIYTNSPKGSVINNCISYFSGYSKEIYDTVYEEYSLDNELVTNVNPFLEKILALPNPNNIQDLNDISKELKKIPGLAKQVSDILPKQITPFAEKLRCLAYASKEELIKSKNEQTPIITFLDKENFAFIIKSTFIIILNKDHEHDKKTLFNKIRREIISKHDSFLLMLGLEMQNNLKNNHSFITGNILDVKNETIAFHWYQNIQHKSEVVFKDFIKQIMIDQVDTTLRKGEFKLLNSDLLNKSKIKNRQEIKQLAQINTFYNGTILDDNRLVGFGDIFRSKSDGAYFLCITALCDCMYPEEKIKNNYYFVQGKSFNIDKALDLADEAFISYIDDNTSIIWPDFGEDTIYDKFKPIYIKPIQLHIPNPKIVDYQVAGMQLLEGNITQLNLKYEFTLRNQYAQRIANHAFTHPLRVGIDFVKRK